jgi:flagellar hook assembly protein FlgD
VKVYDEAGRFQREIVAGKPMNQGSNAEVWDGKDNDGRIVLSGMYIVTVEAGDKVKTKTVGVLNE